MIILKCVNFFQIRKIFSKFVMNFCRVHEFLFQSREHFLNSQNFFYKFINFFKFLNFYQIHELFKIPLEKIWLNNFFQQYYKKPVGFSLPAQQHQKFRKKPTAKFAKPSARVVVATKEGPPSTSPNLEVKIEVCSFLFMPTFFGTERL